MKRRSCNAKMMEHTHISAKQKPFDLKLGELWQYRELIVLFAKRSFQVHYKQTILGPLWLFLNPLLTSLVYVVLFGNIAKLSTDGVPQLLFYMSSHALWSFFSGRISGNAETFTRHAHLFGKVYFPRLTIPAADTVGGIWCFSIQMLMVTGFYAFYFFHGQVHPNLLLLTIPFVIAELGIMGMGVGIIISSLTTKYRDLSVLVEFGLRLWMYATPVVYPMRSVNGALKTILCCNPVTTPMELFRMALFSTGGVRLWGLVYSLVFTIAVALLGMVMFNRVERTFMDTV